MALEIEYAAAVPLSLAAAACFGTAGFLQHQAARSVPAPGPVQPRLVMDLLRLPTFRASLVLSVVAFGLQVTALSIAPLAIVQPLLVTSVLCYLVVASIAFRRPPDARLVVGAVVALVGLAAFQLVSRPGRGSGEFDGAAALPLGVALSCVVVVALLLARRVAGEYRAIPIAAATAVCYGVTATLLRSLLLGNDAAAALSQWQLYAAMLVAPAGFLLNQGAFHTGAVGSDAVTVITVGDPVVSIGTGAAWLGESLAGGTLRTVAEVAALVVMAAGIALLATRAQRVAADLRQLEAAHPRARS
jgi:drug/metabolite transporter (DMT)-like permease